MSPGLHACPLQNDDPVPVDPSSPTALTLPGGRASTVVISAVVNSLFRWTLKTKGAEVFAIYRCKARG